MADVRSGLGGGSGGVDDVNSAAGFAAALAEITGNEASPEHLAKLQEDDRSIAGGLSFGSQKPEEPAPAPTTPAVEEGAAQEEEEPPAYADLLEKHGGDKDAALADLAKQLADSQSFIGKQSDDVGKLREEMAELRGEMRARAEQPAAVAPTIHPSQVTELVAEHDGPSVINWLLEQGVQDGDPAYDAAFEAWIAEDDTGKAVGAYTRYRTELVAQRSGPDPRVDALVQKDDAAAFQQDFNTQLADVASGYTQAEWDALEPYLETVLTEKPDLQELISSSNADTRRAAIGTLTELAGTRALKALAAEERNKENIAAKKAAAVVTGSQRPASASGSSEENGGMSREERLAEFERRMLSAPTTSVQAGLSFGKQ